MPWLKERLAAERSGLRACVRPSGLAAVVVRVMRALAVGFGRRWQPRVRQSGSQWLPPPSKPRSCHRRSLPCLCGCWLWCTVMVLDLDCLKRTAFAAQACQGLQAV
jgi:hypothetical protein